MSSSNAQKRKKKQYYIQGAKKARNMRHLEPGMKGFLMSCNHSEQQAVREAYNLLNEHAEKLYGPEQFLEGKSEKGGEEENEDEDSEEEDMEKALQKEVSAMKSKPVRERRFQNVMTGVNNCLFIRTTLDSPGDLAENIYREIYDTQVAKSRYIMRFLPVIGSCKATEDSIEKLTLDILAPYFNRDLGKQSYIIRFKVRNNNSVSRNTVIPLVGDAVGKLNGQTFVKSEDPDFVIHVDILKTVCCISILRNFEKYGKYNLQEVVKTEKRDKSKSDASDAKKETDEKSTVEDTDKSKESAEKSSIPDDADLEIKPVELEMSPKGQGEVILHEHDELNLNSEKSEPLPVQADPEPK